MSKVVCYSCGKIGHFAMDCRSKPNGNSGNEVGAVAAKNKSKNTTLKTHDIMLCSVTQILVGEVPTTVKGMMADDELLFLDSAASYSTTNSAHGLVDMRAATDEDAAICANGGLSTPKAFGKLPVTVCGKDGKGPINIVLTTVAYVPTSPFDLVSTGDKAKLGWTTVNQC